MDIQKISVYLIEGIYNIVERGIVYPAMKLYDRFRGIDFFKEEYRNDGVCLYEGTHLRISRQLKKLCKDVTKEDSIIDVGCGKGRMLAFYSQYPFRRVDGIDYNMDLIRIARRNMKKLGLKCRVYHADVREFDRFYRYNYFYFYNPFPKETMDVCLDHIILSLRTNPRKITVLYANPTCHQSLIDRGFREVPIRLDPFEKFWQPYLSVLKKYQRSSEPKS